MTPDSSFTLDVGTVLAVALALVFALVLLPAVVLRAPLIRQLLRAIPLSRRLWYTTQFWVRAIHDPSRATADAEASAGDGETGGPDRAAGVTALIREESQRLPGDPRLERPADLALLPLTSKDPLASNVDVIAEGPEGAVMNVLYRLVSKIPPRQVLALDGTLLPPAEKGPGLTLVLSRRGGQIEANVALWEADYDPWRDVPDESVDDSDGELFESPSAAGGGNFTDSQSIASTSSYYFLALLGAAWTQFQLVRLYTRRSEPGNFFRGRKYRVQEPPDYRDFRARTDAERAASILHTYDWKSYALMRAALYWQMRDSKEKARALYVQALGRDPENLLASFQLGVLDILMKDPQQAADRLERIPGRIVQSLPKGAAGPDAAPPSSQPLWYQAVYNLARAKSYIYKDHHQPTPAAHSAAYEETKRLVRAHLRALIWLDETRQKKRFARLTNEQHELRTFLTHLEPVSLILLAGAKLPLDGPEPPPAKRIGTASLTREKILKYIDDLSPSQIVGKYVVRGTEITDRAHYNLACYYSRFAALLEGDERTHYLELSLTELKSGLAPVPVNWPSEDSDLGAVRDERPTKFQDVINRYARPDVKRYHDRWRRKHAASAS